ncbi:hypothetical protein NHH03_11565 [Stieleria sp. TO1_6]|uniref:hypothetical protein n=1 Tax=Stieleria tagensis TaxID=2956795 RepID=UPI00209B1286|nr:hypothetical protein [Stieleria tagensis]MCO8122375.1 hypothetical protein [Stieleria tagensis]
MPATANTAIDRTTPPQRRVWLFRFACVALGLLPFGIAELYLRATTQVDSGDLAIDPIFDTHQQTPLFVRDPSGDRHRIPQSRMNFFRPASFVANKPPRLRRIFVLGGSTVQGRPYETETAFPQWLQLRLQTADPTHNYEVINCGGVSYASYRVAMILDEVLGYAPDAIVLYTGHNEFLEERSYATLPDHSGTLPGAAQRVLKRSALVQTIGRWIRPATTGQSRGTPATDRQVLSAEVETRLDLINGMERYVRDDAWRRAVAEHFATSLDRMIRACQQQQIPLIVCSPASDVVATPPMKILSIEMDKTTRSVFDENWQLACDADRDDEQRIEACENCLRIDPQHCGAQFIAGKLHWNHNRSDRARPYLVAARDNDVCPLRATTPILQKIESVTAEHGLVAIPIVPLLDRTDAQGRPLPDGIPDPQQFVDHVHPTISGHQDIAARLARELIGVFRIEATESAETDYQHEAREHLKTLDETYYARGKQRLKGLQQWAAGRAGRLSL